MGAPFSASKSEDFHVVFLDGFVGNNSMGFAFCLI
jgi:hypothetical protein